MTNNPAPYRIPVYNAIGLDTGIDLHVVFCTTREPNREWNLPPIDRPHYYLRDRFLTYRGGFIHFNLDVFDALKTIQPDVVITAGFNPTHLFAYIYALRNGCAHIPMTDGTLDSERSLGWIHRLVRRWVFRRSRAFLAAANAGLDIYRSYGCPEESLFRSTLCVNNAAFAAPGLSAKRFDLLFCGRLTSVKNPLFVLEVAQAAAKLLGRRLSVCFVGSGSFEAAVRRAAASLTSELDVTLVGFVKQEELPRWYAQSRVFLLPSRWDPWGVVANEACAAGLPVISSPHAGVAGELVREGETGFVRELDVELWSEAVARLLQDDALYAAMSRAASRVASEEYTVEGAAGGIVAAVRHSTHRRVVIAQRRLTHYRVPFFNHLRERLASEGIDLKVLYGNPNRAERSRRDSGALTWGRHVRCRYAFGGRVCWQNISRHLWDADLVIVAQENKLLYNLFALLFHRPRRIAFWGHGRNFQRRSAYSALEQLKFWLSDRVDWWFAYTSMSADIVKSRGFPVDRITVTNNAVDTASLRHELEIARSGDVRAIRKRLGLGQGPVGLFIGSLDKNKRLPFLIESAVLVKSGLQNFTLVIAGDGPDRPLVESAVRQHDFIKYLGVVDGGGKAELLSVADIMLNPGMIGLGILDAFVAGIPIITTDCEIHSPEIAYLKSGYNGIVTENETPAYVAAIKRLLDEPFELQELGKGAATTAQNYSLNNMTERFAEGITSCLQTVKARPGRMHLERFA